MGCTHGAHGMRGPRLACRPRSLGGSGALVGRGSHSRPTRYSQVAPMGCRLRPHPTLPCACATRLTAPIGAGPPLAMPCACEAHVAGPFGPPVYLYAPQTPFRLHSCLTRSKQLFNYFTNNNIIEFAYRELKNLGDVSNTTERIAISLRGKQRSLKIFEPFLDPSDWINVEIKSFTYK